MKGIIVLIIFLVFNSSLLQIQKIPKPEPNIG